MHEFYTYRDSTLLSHINHCSRTIRRLIWVLKITVCRKYPIISSVSKTQILASYVGQCLRQLPVMELAQFCLTHSFVASIFSRIFTQLLGSAKLFCLCYKQLHSQHLCPQGRLFACLSSSHSMATLHPMWLLFHVV